MKILALILLLLIPTSAFAGKHCAPCNQKVVAKKQASRPCGGQYKAKCDTVVVYRTRTVRSPAVIYTKRVATSKASTTSLSLSETIANNFRINAGFRFETEDKCPTLINPHRHREVKDPFFIGAELRIPVSERVDLFGTFDRDFTDAPNWQSRIGVSYAPFYDR